MTCSNALSKRTSYCLHDLRSERLTTSPSSGMTPLGSGDHQANLLATGIGNNPQR